MSNYNTQRYRAEAGVNPHGKPYVKFIEHDEGECVKYEDHAITCAELEEAKKEAVKWEEKFDAKFDEWASLAEAYDRLNEMV